MFRYFIALYVFVSSFQAFANQPNPLITKTFLVSFSSPQNADALNELTAYRFRGFEAINLDHTIFKAVYAPSNLSETEALQLIRRLPGFSVVQEDGPVYLRSTTPNDTLFSSQWYMSKISANKAWDSVTGGVNRRGDTIVIAVVDDGLHIHHPDFKNNIWINYADLDGNGIDDDSNGFIDDHYGWNFMGRNNDISDSTNYAAYHGSWVSGVIGARGNDMTGISGILWNVKMMYSNIADSGSTALPKFRFQSDVIRAYDYVLQQRKLYNKTNGLKGAFVVAINSSWGVDNRFPNQAPLWCAFYDSLGAAGILTAGATSNGENKVEDTGDLPSLCTSQHLIVVSSVNSSDMNAKRGYGTTSVDIHAPGEGIFTTNSFTKYHRTSPGGMYGTFSGTSAATPMVTGAIGLLHAFACDKLIDVMKTDPVRANQLIRRFIMDGVDTLPDLVGKSVTAGRLNIYKAMRIMDEYCYGTLGTQDLRVVRKIVLYPNPGNGVLNIEAFSAIQKVECYDMSGKSLPCQLDGNKMDISNLSRGVYVFRIYTAEGINTVRYLKGE